MKSASVSQLRAISDRLKELGHNERTSLPFLSQLVGRDITHGDDLSATEATLVLNILRMEYAP